MMRGLNGDETSNVRANAGVISGGGGDWGGKNSTDRMRTCVKGTYNSAGNGVAVATSPATTTLATLLPDRSPKWRSHDSECSPIPRFH